MDIKTVSDKFKITELKADSTLEKRLYSLFRKSISYDVSISDFRDLFKKIDEMHLIFFRRNEEDVGFLYYTKHEVSSTTTIIRPAAGTLPNLRIKSFNSGNFALLIIWEKLRNPHKNIYILSKNINPIAYAALCKYWHDTYPSPTREPTPKILKTFEECVEYFELTYVGDYVVEIPFSFIIIDRDFEKMRKSNVYVEYYFSRIHDRLWNKGVLTLTPVSFRNFKNILVTIMKKKLGRKRR
jgi:hypothetical protein